MLLLRKNIFQSYHCKRLFIGSSDMPRHGLSSPQRVHLALCLQPGAMDGCKKGGSSLSWRRGIIKGE